MVVDPSVRTYITFVHTEWGSLIPLKSRSSHRLHFSREKELNTSRNEVELDFSSLSLLYFCKHTCISQLLWLSLPSSSGKFDYVWFTAFISLSNNFQTEDEVEQQPDKRIMVPMRSSLKDLNFGKLLQGMNPTIVGKFYF